MKEYDVLVIGAGGGLKIALHAARMGLKTALVEQEAIGGTCLNRGCIPSKMLIYPGMLLEGIRRAGRINIHGTEKATLQFPQLVRRIAATVDEMEAGRRQQVEQTANLDFYPEHGEFCSDRILRAGGEELTAKRIFIASGSRPLLPDIPGLEGTPFMTSREALRRTQLPKRLLVIGAGYIAVELGAAYAAAGAEVEFIVRSRFLRKEDTEVAEEFSRIFQQSHTVHLGWTPVQVDYESGFFSISCRDAAGRTRVLAGDALLAAAGVKPCTDELGLEKTRIRVDKDGLIRVDGRLQTDVDGVYALGDCVGNYLYRHTANYESEYLIRTVLEGVSQEPIDYGPVPHAVFSVPEIASVGLTEQQASQRGLDYRVGRASYPDSNVGLARGYSYGFVKILIERSSRQILGAHILGDEASNMIHLFIALMKKKGTLDDLLGMIWIHPALPEVARDAARNAQEQMIS